MAMGFSRGDPKLQEHRRVVTECIFVFTASGIISKEGNGYFVSPKGSRFINQSRMVTA
jgi:hypothetical protein